MTHVSCPSCRLRFAHALAAYLADCPLCGGLLDRSTGAGPMLGYWLFDADSSEPQGSGLGPPIAAGTAAPGHRPLANATSAPIRP